MKLSTTIGLFALAGAVSAEGRVRVAGRAIRLGRPGAVLRGGLGFVPEDRKAKGLLPERSVTENLSVAWPQHIFRYGIRRPRAESGGHSRSSTFITGQLSPQPTAVTMRHSTPTWRSRGGGEGDICYPMPSPAVRRSDRAVSAKCWDLGAPAPSMCTATRT